MGRGLLQRGMATLVDFLLFIGVLAVWMAGILVLDRRGILAKHNLVLVGPFLMVKTRRGRDLIDRASRFRRAWRGFGDLSIVLLGLTMVGITALPVLEAVLLRDNPPGRGPGPETLLRIPGLHPDIPLGDGIFP